MPNMKGDSVSNYVTLPNANPSFQDIWLYTIKVARGFSFSLTTEDGLGLGLKYSQCFLVFSKWWVIILNEWLHYILMEIEISRVRKHWNVVSGESREASP